LKDILARHFLDARFAEAETATGALDHIRSKPWDILVLDVTIPGRGGLEILKEAKKLLAKKDEENPAEIPAP